MQDMIKVFKDAPELDGMVGQPYVRVNQVGEICIDGHFSTAYLYTKLNAVFNDENEQA